jgi:hypothetical protein
MRSHSVCVALAALALTTGTRAEDAYTIKLKRGPEVGKSTVLKDNNEHTATTRFLDADGNPTAKDMKHTEKNEEVYTETVLEKGDGHATKFKRTYTKATRTQDGKTETRSFEGRTLIFEEKNGKFTVAVEGDKPVSKEDLEMLTRKVNEQDDAQEDVLLPTKPVKVGESWKVDAKALVKAFSKNGKLDPEHSGAEGKLVKVYQKDGHQYGTLELTVRLAPGTTPPGVKFDKPPVVGMKITLDTAIDGSTTAGKMAMTGGVASKATVEQMGMKLTIDNKVELSGTKEQSGEK